MPNDLIKNGQSFWNTKEGTTGFFFGLGLLGLLGWGAYKVMPYVADLMENTFWAVAFGLGAFVLLYVTVVDSTLRNLLWRGYKAAMKGLTYSFIKYDPFGFLRVLQDEARERIKKVQSCHEAVAGQLKIIENQIAEFQRDSSDVRATVSVMQRRGLGQDRIDNETMKLGQLSEAIADLTRNQKLIQNWSTKLGKAQEALEAINDNIEFKISLEERKYRAVTASNTAWRLVRDAFKGQSEEAQLREQTLQFVADDYGQKLGEIDVFMQQSQKFIDAVDMQNAINTEKGRQMLEELDTHDVSEVKTLVNNPSATITDINPSSIKTVDYLNLRK